MELLFDKLNKFLRLEVEKGHKNIAIIGGLDKIIPWWKKEAVEKNLDPEYINGVTQLLSQYPGQDIPGREKTIQEIIDLVEKHPAGKAIRKSPPVPQRPPENIHSQRAGSERHNQPREQYASHPQQQRQGQPNSGRPQVYPTTVGLDAPLTTLNSIGPQRAKSLSLLGLETLYNLLYYFPRRYDDYSKLKPINRLDYGEVVTVIGTIHSIEARSVKGGKVRQYTEAVITDSTGFLRIIWFNQVWIAQRLKPGDPIVVSGKIEQSLGRPIMKSPDWEPLEKEHLHTNRIVPVYALTSEVTQRILRGITHDTVAHFAPRLPDFLPEKVRSSTGLMPLSQAIFQIHWPENLQKLDAARARLAFDEIFLLQIGVLQQKRNWQSAEAEVFEVPAGWLENLVSTLPYSLTAAQQKTVNEIQKDLASGRPMNRLIQGDVGSGKTVVAAMAVAIVTKADGQAAFMAPTSILAEQHYRSLQKILSNGGGETAPLQPQEIRLLVGDTSESEKQEIRQGLEEGSIKLLIGTHALIEDPVQFKNLELAIVDEQHRFGVGQRALLRSKGQNPHLLVMTATPIPRSLALTVYGDLDLSVIDEMPLGRQPIETHVLHPLERERAYQIIRAQVKEGRQAFVIYPLVEKGEREDGKAAVDEHERLQKEVFPDLKLGLLHGRLKPEEKDKVMVEFNKREYDILISTSVVEVGVDVPNATVMLIEGANRFGLAQLHQFRGRVGRGEAKSYCLLIPENEDSLENQRLAVMTETNDGFILADRDLQQRGPGEFLGTRQSGYSELRLASLTDVRLIEKAREQAQSVFEEDPDLAGEQYAELCKMVNRFWSGGKGDIS